MGEHTGKVRVFSFFAGLAGVAILVLSFQNFSSIPLENLRPSFPHAQARVLSINDPGIDIRDVAPKRPQDLQQSDSSESIAPRSGTDLNSVGQDWVARQTSLLTEGADQKLLASVNKSMNRWIGAGNSDANQNAKPNGDRNPAGVGAPPVQDSHVSQHWALEPTSIRFSSINKLEVGLANDAKLSCSVHGDSLQWDLTHPVNHRFDFNLHHETHDNANSLRLNYNW